MNGQRLGEAPRRLRPGSHVLVGWTRLTCLELPPPAAAAALTARPHVVPGAGGAEETAPRLELGAGRG